MFLTKISTKKYAKTTEERERRKKGLALKAKERAEILNRIVSSDPNYGLHSRNEVDSPRTSLVAERKLLSPSAVDRIVPAPSETTMPHRFSLKKRRRRSG